MSDEIDRLLHLVDRTVPAFANGSVATGMALENVAYDFANEYDQLFPDAAAASKRHARGYGWAPAFTFTRPDPKLLLIDEINFRLDDGSMVRDFNWPSTSIGTAFLYSGKPHGIDLGPGHRPINELAARIGKLGHLDYSAYQTQAGHWRLGDHELGCTPSSSALADDELRRVVINARQFFGLT